MSALFEVEGLHVVYESLGRVNRAVTDVSFSVGRGEVVGIVGESGSGKSTAALAALGLCRHGGRITAGSIKLDGSELLGLPPSRWREIRGGRLALVTQNPRGALSPVAHVGDQIAAVYRAHHAATKAVAEQEAIGLLRTVGINDPERRMRAFPHELSGGMAQRVVIAMALVARPEILIADEPTSGLDVTVQAQVLDDLREAASETGSSLLIVTQDLGIVANYCDRVYMMHAGEVMEESGVRTMFREPAGPATVALLAAQRRISSERVRISGFPVDGRNLPAGCWLEPRCPFADAEAGCATIHPELRQLGPDHRVRCHRSEIVRASSVRLFGGLDAEPHRGIDGEPHGTPNEADR
jgi:peptide/nickel transport system ATP-binding protein